MCYLMAAYASPSIDIYCPMCQQFSSFTFSSYMQNLTIYMLFMYLLVAILVVNKQKKSHLQIGREYSTQFNLNKFIEHMNIVYAVLCNGHVIQIFLHK